MISGKNNISEQDRKDDNSNNSIRSKYLINFSILISEDNHLVAFY